VPVSPLDHTADAGIEVRAASLDALFAEAAAGLCGAITDPAGLVARHSAVVEVSAPDLEMLLVEWLQELLFRFETTGALPARVEVAVAASPAGGWRLRATVHEEAFDPDRHPLAVAIKAVTYHGLRLEQGPDGWRATVIFDV
jgi:SHS2 domain-containing protein